MQRDRPRRSTVRPQELALRGLASKMEMSGSGPSRTPSTVPFLAAIGGIAEVEHL